MNNLGRSTILVVDDTPDNLTLMIGLLKDQYKVKAANSGEKALDIAQSESPPDLILLDIMMPKMDGYTVCCYLKENPKTAHIPIIFLTAKTEVADETKGFELGAVDYITKPINPTVVMSRVKTHLDVKKMQDLLREKNILMQETLGKVEEMHNQTKASIEYASIIQRTILPNMDDFHAPFTDSFAIWKPKDIVGGDVWFFEQLNGEDEYLLFVIDCTGHGVPGAFVTMLVKSIQRTIMLEYRNTGKEIYPQYPSQILSIFNWEIKNLLNQYTRESKSNVGFDGGIVYINKKEGIIRFSSAETPLFLVDKNGKCTTIKGSRHSVGYRSSEEYFMFTEHEIKMDSFDRLYLTTDGLLDQNGGAKDIPFGKKRLISIIEANHDKPLNEIKDIVMNDLAEWRGTSEQNDDITFVGIKI